MKQKIRDIIRGINIIILYGFFLFFMGIIFITSSLVDGFKNIVNVFSKSKAMISMIIYLFEHQYLYSNRLNFFPRLYNSVIDTYKQIRSLI